jgi:GAF domain-containing protein
MAEELIVPHNTNKFDSYAMLYKQAQALLHSETDSIANMANLAAVLKQGMGFFWVGFYLIKADDLVLGPFQGPVACTRIKKGKGVCGTSWQNQQHILVPNVDDFTGHIACSSGSKSEVVIFLKNKHNQPFGVLDVDSELLNNFDEIDVEWLQKFAALLNL